jgi:putative PIN family toxin of toxin-antitoxin system
VRVVLDTNVVFSRAHSPTGAPATLFRAWQEGRFDLLASEAILAEYEAVLRHPRSRARHGLSVVRVDALIADVRRAAVLVPTTGTLRVVRADPSDDKFIECAVAGQADYVVSGDEHLLELREHAGIWVLSPRAFLAVLELG